jgi:hypothetical protein
VNVLLSFFNPFKFASRYIVGLHQACVDCLFNIMASSYKYRQGSDFWYLTGFEEPDSAVVLGTSLRFSLSLDLISTREECVFSRI